jgi:MtN3 and saliva related transmembrane protein
MKTFIIGMAAATLCALSFVPQIIKIYKTKTTRDLSVVTFLFFMLGVILWLIYGLMIKEFPIIIANSLTLIFIFIIIAMKLKYG